MSPSEYPTIAHIRNESQADIRLHLEMTGAEVVLPPGHAVEILAKPSEMLLPLTIDYVEGGLQIHPYKEFDPDWHLRFRGKLVRADNLTVLSAGD